MKVLVFAVLLYTSLSQHAIAQQAFTLTGDNGELPPITLAVEEGSRLIPCAGNPSPTKQRCLLFSREREDQIRHAYRAQILALGWRTNGITSFTPVSTIETCPPFVMVFPASGSHYEPGAIPDNGVFYFVSYGADVMCQWDRLYGQ